MEALVALYSNVTEEKHNMSLCCLCGVIQVPDLTVQLASKWQKHHVLNQNVHCTLLNRNLVHVSALVKSASHLSKRSHEQHGHMLCLSSVVFLNLVVMYMAARVFHCIGTGSNSFRLWNSIRVMWFRKYHHGLNQHSGEQGGWNIGWTIPLRYISYYAQAITDKRCLQSNCEKTKLHVNLCPCLFHHALAVDPDGYLKLNNLVRGYTERCL